jgi:hypothetical protein
VSDRFVTSSFRFLDWPEDSRIHYWDEGDVRVWWGKSADGLLFSAVGRRGAAPASDLTFWHPTYGAGSKAQLAGFLAKIRSSPAPDWTGIGAVDGLDAKRWVDPVETGLPGELVRLLATFDPNSPL